LTRAARQAYEESHKPPLRRAATTFAPPPRAEHRHDGRSGPARLTSRLEPKRRSPDIAGARRYNTEGISVTPVDAVAVPKAAFDELMARSAEFRRFVFSDYSSRITDLLHVVEDVAFERIDKRLAQKLLDLAHSEGRLGATHPEPAVELGSAREVVSRHLKEFQRRGWLELTRGLIYLTDRASLERLAAGS
jgi:hypothetical protein